MVLTREEIENNENGYVFNDESDGLYALVNGEWVVVEIDE